MPERDRVKPAAAPGPPGSGAEFAPGPGQVSADAVVQLGGKGAGADARGICLGHPEHVVEMARAKAGARGGAARGRVGGGHEGIGAVIDIQPRALRPFKQDIFALGAKLVQALAGVGEQGRDLLAELIQFRQRLLVVNGSGLVIAGQDKIIIIQRLFQFAGQPLAVGQIAGPQGAPRHLVFIGRPDAAPGGAERGLAPGRLARPIQGHMPGHDQGGGRADPQ